MLWYISRMKAAVRSVVSWRSASGAVDRPSRQVVEFVGLPGVGKSFLSRRLDERFRRAGIGEVSTAFQADLPPLRAVPFAFGKVVRALRFAALHIETTAALVRIVRSDGGGLGAGRLTKLINLLSELTRSARVPAAHMLINEQGVLQAIWSLEMRAGEPVHERLLGQCARWLPDAVVFVEVEWRQNVDRLRGRKDGHSRFDTLSDERLDREASKGGPLLHAILASWAAEAPEGRQLDFRNDDGADVGIIFGWLDEVRAAGRAGLPAAPDAVAPLRSSGPGSTERGDGRPQERG